MSLKIILKDYFNFLSLSQLNPRAINPFKTPYETSFSARILLEIPSLNDKRKSQKKYAHYKNYHYLKYLLVS